MNRRRADQIARVLHTKEATHELRARIERYLRATWMTPSGFGRAVIKDPNFVLQLEDGRQMRPATIARVTAWLDVKEAEIAACLGMTDKYCALKAFGHSSAKAFEIILDASRDDPYAIRWLNVAQGIKS